PEGADGGGPDRDEPPSRRAAQEVRDPLRIYRLRADRRAARPSVPPRRRGDGHRLLARDLLDLLDRTDGRREPRRQGDHLPDGRDVGDQRGLPGPGRLGVQPSGEGGVDHSGRRVGRPVLHPSDRRGPRHRGRHATEAGLMRIRILDRYVLSEFLRLFLLFAAAAPVLFILGDVTDNLDRHLNRGYTAVQILLNYVYQVPLFVLYSFPIASLIASVFTVHSMTRYSEVTAAKAGGVSFYRLYAPLPILGVALTVAGLGISELVPIAERARVAALEESANRGRTSRTDFVYRTADGWVLSVRRLDAGRGTMTRVVAEREGNEPEIPSIYIHAQEAVYSAETGWVLRNGIYRSMFGPEVERAFRFYELRMPGL